MRPQNALADVNAPGISHSQPLLRYSRRMPVFRIKEAASLLGVSDDTLRRWADGGRIETTTDVHGWLAVDGVVLARFARELAESGAPGNDRAVTGHSVRNRFSGLVSRVVRDTVMAQVEIQAGPHRFVSLLSREAADELGLEPGMLAVAAVKATNVSVEIPQASPTGSAKTTSSGGRPSQENRTADSGARPASCAG
jgi:molybdopterin-binding protein